MELKIKAKKLLNKLNGLDEYNDRISSKEREHFELKYIIEAFEELISSN
jgi:hypothetical protein